MKLWIDNTGLHSAGACLEGRANPEHDYDVRGLLQLATLVIYGKKVTLNGFENSLIASRSREITQKLQVLGITEDVLSINSVTEVEYGLACKTAADSVAPELSEGFNPQEFQLIGGGPPDLPRGFKDRQVRSLELANEPEGSSKLQDAEARALSDKAIGAVEFMLAVSPALREAVARTMAINPNWSDNHSYQLNIFLRYHLNSALGDQYFSRYAPAIPRAELVSRRSEYVIETLGKTLDKAVADLRGEPLGVPSTLAALLQRSKGDPMAVLTVAREFRERSKPLRDALNALAAKYSDDTPESRFEIQKEIKELGHQLRRDVGLESAIKFRDAVEIKLIIGFPVPAVSVKEIAKWVQQKIQSRRVAVLTELVRASAYSDFSTNLYARLRDQSSRNS